MWKSVHTLHYQKANTHEPVFFQSVFFDNNSVTRLDTKQACVQNVVRNSQVCLAKCVLFEAAKLSLKPRARKFQ